MLEQEQKRKIKIVVCDDEPAMLVRLKKLIEETVREDWETELYCAESPQQLLPSLDHVQLAVLDIQLPEQTGIELARRILQKSPDCRIIFVSGYVRYVSDVYDVPHFCMILKDQLDVQLPKFLLRAAKQLTTDESEKLTISSNGVNQSVDTKMVYYMERRGHITYVRLRSGHWLKTREKLADVVKKDTEGSLCRCHISYAVNLQWVANMGKDDFTMLDGEHIPISRSNKQIVKDAYYHYLKEIF